jgi:hypothetical protein
MLGCAQGAIHAVIGDDVFCRDPSSEFVATVAGWPESGLGFEQRAGYSRPVPESFACCVLQPMRRHSSFRVDRLTQTLKSFRVSVEWRIFE